MQVSSSQAQKQIPFATQNRQTYTMRVHSLSKKEKINLVEEIIEKKRTENEIKKQFFLKNTQDSQYLSTNQLPFNSEFKPLEKEKIKQVDQLIKCQQKSNSLKKLIELNNSKSPIIQGKEKHFLFPLNSSQMQNKLNLTSETEQEKRQIFVQTNCSRIQQNVRNIDTSKNRKRNLLQKLQLFQKETNKIIPFRMEKSIINKSFGKIPLNNGAEEKSNQLMNNQRKKSKTKHTLILRSSKNICDLLNSRQAEQSGKKKKKKICEFYDANTLKLLSENLEKRPKDILGYLFEDKRSTGNFTDFRQFYGTFLEKQQNQFFFDYKRYFAHQFQTDVPFRDGYLSMETRKKINKLNDTIQSQISDLDSIKTKSYTVH